MCDNKNIMRLRNSEGCENIKSIKKLKEELREHKKHSDIDFLLQANHTLFYLMNLCV